MSLSPVDVAEVEESGAAIDVAGAAAVTTGVAPDVAVSAGALLTGNCAVNAEALGWWMLAITCARFPTGPAARKLTA